MTPKPKAPTESTALVLVRHVWDNYQEATAHSWRRLNAAMHDAVSLAIRAGLQFATPDFATMFADMRGDYWFGYGPEQRGEGLYKIAVEYANLSACVSFETWKGRPPFIYGGRRLTADAAIEHFGDLHRARLTSFADDGQSIVLCTYKEREAYSSSDREIDRRVRVTIEGSRSFQSQVGHHQTAAEAGCDVGSGWRHSAGARGRCAEGSRLMLTLSAKSAGCFPAMC